jgi:hypothetical protein
VGPTSVRASLPFSTFHTFTARSPPPRPVIRARYRLPPIHTYRPAVTLSPCLPGGRASGPLFQVPNLERPITRA